MKYVLFILGWLGLSEVWAQVGEMKLLRYEETYTELKNDSNQTWYKRLKFKPLNQNKSIYWSQGGEVRYQLQDYRNEDWGSVNGDTYTAFFTRFLYHSDIWLGQNFRIFGQLNSTFANGRTRPNRSIDENRLDIQQIFADWYVLNTDNQRLMLRVGRQELLYGSQRIIAVREGPNNRQSFDALKVVYKRNNWQLDAFYSHPVRLRQGILDDKFNQDQRLGGLYSVWKKAGFLGNVDVYYLNFWSRESAFNQEVAEEMRHSLGTRIWHKSPTWNYDLEALYQFGSFGAQKINAYTASANVSYTWAKTKTQPTLGIKTEIISGDRQRADNQQNTFNPLYPRGAYFGLAALIGPANLVDFHPSLSFNLRKDWSLLIDYDIFWRYSLRDGIYGPNVALIFEGESANRFIGRQLGISMEYTPNAFLSIVPEFTWFEAGQYLREVSAGKDVFFTALTVQLKY
ncbi:MAG: alginate export family protein [Microscillaceae bacterium]|jgi:hypothetical protein|nr:alginate export family protein [Microscillaceae bacterium]